jgi:hypothetical protein
MDPPLADVAFMSLNGCDSWGNHLPGGGEFHGWFRQLIDQPS